jgi:hypothetical protein
VADRHTAGGASTSTPASRKSHRALAAELQLELGEDGEGQLLTCSCSAHPCSSMQC